ncbi:tetratricopeptide repeat protein [Klebsiella quasipneumoniae]|uniref:tetratricopeptide repeat protein n=1 Tax=Klebsiella quasipneumoniae TaxID=1463165 RepID=UPI000CCB8AA1|nr:tetratricopeptide repeat protein [Klebsiella quasipneumoniae]PLF70489.1 hypothetical protein B6I99_28685 [Klebsiella quasipneumoniae]TNC53943.1 tetratricopeptide repeat protein [Klebsiella quasipneumoniae]HBX4902563.1 tetratricopeptide repeat protein [Klebsiella pneumoniae]HBX4908278.1 tetratricopeptide repeat protein [Klebsiella pneumoniae]
MISPQTETNALINKILPSIEDPRVFLTEFELAGITRKARNIPARDEGLLIEGIAYLAAGDAKKGIELCERSLSLNPRSHVAWMNYASLLGNRGYYRLQREVFQRAMDLGIFAIYIPALHCSIFWLYEEHFERSLNFFIKTNVIKNELTEHLKQKIGDMLSWKSNLPIISPFAQIAFEIADNERLLTFDNYICQDEEIGFHYSLSIDCNDASRLCKLNKIATDMILERNLQHVDCTVVFVAEVNNAQ